MGDFHCGLRAFRKDSILRLNLRTTGMEFASEMVVKASYCGLRTTEVPTTLKKEGEIDHPISAIGATDGTTCDSC